MRVIHHQPARVVSGQQALVKLAGQGRGLGIQRLQLGFLRFIQARAGQNKALVRLLDQPTGFGIQRGAVLPDALDAGEKSVVQPDVVRQRGKFGGELLFQFLQVRISVRGGHGEENAADAREHDAAFLQRQHGVSEVWRSGVRDYRLYVRPLLAKRFIEGRTIMLVFDGIKMGSLVRQQADVKKGVGGRHLSLLRTDIFPE